MALISPLVEHVDFIQTTKSYCWHQAKSMSVTYGWILNTSQTSHPGFAFRRIPGKVSMIATGVTLLGESSQKHPKATRVIWREAMAGTSKSAIYSLDWFSGTFSPETLVFTIQYRGFRWTCSLKPIQWFTNRIFMDFPWQKPAIWDPWNPPISARLRRRSKRPTPRAAIFGGSIPQRGHKKMM